MSHPTINTDTRYPGVQWTGVDWAFGQDRSVVVVMEISGTPITGETVMTIVRELPVTNVEERVIPLVNKPPLGKRKSYKQRRRELPKFLR